MGEKIKVLAVPSDRSGVGYFRSLNPHLKLASMYSNDFDVTIDDHPDWSDLSSFSNYDIIHYSKGLGNRADQTDAITKVLKEKRVTMVMDIDDYWDVGYNHPSYLEQKQYHIAEILKNNLKNADYVTTTTPIFATEIKKFNSNVEILPNAIDTSDSEFIPHDEPCKRLRIGLIMGSSHEQDMELIRGMVSSLTDIQDKIQWVLCGYDLRGTIKMYNPQTKEMQERPILPKESVWYRYEKIITDDYRICSPEYKAMLLQFKPADNFPGAEDMPYRRFWTKPITSYATHYNHIDVLLAPLKETQFNKVKSPLKVAEAGMFSKALIAQNFGPYTLDLVNANGKGGEINPEGNAMLIDTIRNHKDWAKSIRKLVNNPDLVQQLKTNLHNTVKDKYSIETVTKQRAEFYKKIMEDKQK